VKPDSKQSGHPNVLHQLLQAIGLSKGIHQLLEAIGAPKGINQFRDYSLFISFGAIPNSSVLASFSLLLFAPGFSPVFSSHLLWWSFDEGCAYYWWSYWQI